MVMQRIWQWGVAGVCLGLGLVLLAACERKQEPPRIEITGREDAQETSGEMRLVSLAPALTQMIADLGQTRLLAGVARNDDAAPPDLPVVGDVLDINSEALQAVHPTHVLMMLTKEGVPQRLEELALRAHFKIVAYRSPLAIEEVGNILFDENEILPGAVPKATPSLGTLLNVQVRASRLKVNMFIRLGKLDEITFAALHGAERPRVLLVIGTNPLMAVGPDTVHHQLLASLNAVNAVGDSAVGAPTLDKEKLLAARPDVIVFLSPKAPDLQPLDQDPRLAVFRGLDIPAVRNDRIALVNESTAMLPSSSLDRVGAALAKAIYPRLSDKIDQMMRSDVFHTPDSAAPTQPQDAATAPAPQTAPAHD